MNERKKGQKEARIGLDSEKDIVRAINTDRQFRSSIKECLSTFGFVAREEIKAYTDGTKTDIFIHNGFRVGVSIKSSTKTSFHSMDRRRLQNWKKYLNMPDEIFKILKESILRIAQNSRNKFILPKDRQRVKDFFVRHLREIINEIFTKGEDRLKIFLINDKRRHKIYLFKMDDVINFLLNNARNSVNFSPKGIMHLGDFLSMQRKSGDGSHITIPKTNWEHPGNHLQFKFSPLKFAEHIEENRDIKVCIV